MSYEDYPASRIRPAHLVGARAGPDNPQPVRRPAPQQKGPGVRQGPLDRSYLRSDVSAGHAGERYAPPAPDRTRPLLRYGWERVLRFGHRVRDRVRHIVFVPRHCCETSLQDDRDRHEEWARWVDGPTVPGHTVPERPAASPCQSAGQPPARAQYCGEARNRGMISVYAVPNSSVGTVTASTNLIAAPSPHTTSPSVASVAA